MLSLVSIFCHLMIFNSPVMFCNGNIGMETLPVYQLANEDVFYLLLWTICNQN
jgi:hypothetical protein